MPQMSPMWWTTLFIMFYMTYMLYMIIMYFCMSYHLDKNLLKKSTKNMSWTW